MALSREQMAMRVAQELQADEDMQAWINEWLVDALVTVVDQNRAQIASVIRNTAPVAAMDTVCAVLVDRSGSTMSARP